MINIIAVARISKSNDKGTLGYRLLDMETGEVQDINLENVRVALWNHWAWIANLGADDGYVYGSNGDDERLARLENGVLVSRPTIVIVNEAKGYGYTIADYVGRMYKLSTADVIKLGEKYGIANGSVVHLENGTTYIRAIASGYKWEDANGLKTKANIGTELSVIHRKDATPIVSNMHKINREGYDFTKDDLTVHNTLEAIAHTVRPSNNIFANVTGLVKQFFK